MQTAPSAADLRGRMLVVAGMSRGGTTYLYHHLPRHPEIFGAARKELCYFGHNHHRGAQWMLDAYAGMGSARYALDVCGLYFFSAEDAAQRILDFDPDARCLLVLRDPVEWVVSVYEHYSTLWDTPPLARFIEGCVWKRDGRDIALSFTRGRVKRSVETFRSAFGANLLICDFRLLERNPVALLGSIEAFLGLRPFFDPSRVDETRYNARGSRSAGLVHRLGSIPGAAWLSSALPRSFTLGLRRTLERGAGPGQTERLTRRVTDEERADLVAKLDADRTWLRTIFDAAPVIDGEAQPRYVAGTAR